MKRYLLLVSLLALCASTSPAQDGRLSTSRRNSPETFIYKLGVDDLRDIHLHGQPMDESRLHTLVTSYGDDSPQPTLPRGNYVAVRAEGANLSYRKLTVDDIHFRKIPGKIIKLAVLDSLDRPVTDASVKYRGRPLAFNKETMTYDTRNMETKGVVEVNNKGVYHYLVYRNYREGEKLTQKVARFFTGLFVPKERRDRQYRSRHRERHDGFVAFSKPKYRPGDTVRFKAYLTDTKGRPYRKEVFIGVGGWWEADTVMRSLAPYRPGMYEWEFPLPDSLGLELDSRYYLLLLDKKMNQLIRGIFSFEEYDLDKVIFSVKTDKNQYANGEEVKMEIRATDENGIDIYDGKVEVTIEPAGPVAKAIQSGNTITVPHILWRYETDISSLRNGLVIPDSVFPPNAHMNYAIRAELLTADNEKHQKNVNVQYSAPARANQPSIDIKVEKGIMHIRARRGTKELNTTGVVTAKNRQGTVLSRKEVSLPAKFAIDPRAESYDVSAETASASYKVDTYADVVTTLEGKMHRSNDTVTLSIQNPLGLSFWYEVRKGNISVDEGFSTDKEFVRHYNGGSQGYIARITYTANSYRLRDIDVTSPFVRDRHFTIDVATPPVVYPGQKADFDISVTDRKGRPGKNIDITAFAHKSTLGAPYLALKDHNSYKMARQPANKGYRLDELDRIKGDRRIVDRERWMKEMNLGSIEFYRFLYPDPLYTHTEPAPGHAGTHLMPFVLVDGKAQGVFVVWIDDVPYYVRNFQHNDIYSIPVEAGYHDLRLRTYDSEVTIENLWIEEGCKNVVAVDGGRITGRMVPETGKKEIGYRIEPMPDSLAGRLSAAERKELGKYMISIKNTSDSLKLTSRKFVYFPYTVGTQRRRYSIDPNKGVFRDRESNRYQKWNFITGPFPELAGGEAAQVSVWSDTVKIYGFRAKASNYYYPDGKGGAESTTWPYAYPWGTLEKYTPRLDFRQEPLPDPQYQSPFTRTMCNIITRGLYSGQIGKAHSGKLGSATLSIRNENENNERAALVYLRYARGDESLFYGATSYFENLPAGKAQLFLIYSDSTIYKYDLSLQDRSRTFVMHKGAGPQRDPAITDRALNMLFRAIEYPRVPPARPDDALPEPKAAYTSGENETIIGIVSDDLGPMFSVNVSVENRVGRTLSVALTNHKGEYTLNIPTGETGLNIVISNYGYKTQFISYTGQKKLDICLESYPDQLRLEVLARPGQTSDAFGLIPYDGQVDISQYQEMASVVSVEDMLVGKIAGMESIDVDGRATGTRIRGTSVIESEGNPLIVVDGKPLDINFTVGVDTDIAELGALVDIDPADIIDISILHGRAATGLWGEKASHGVIMITTRASNRDGAYDPDSPAQPIRRNFHDDAFWHPDLTTDSEGKASFSATYPDDITKWRATFVALDGKGRTNRTNLDIKAFKPITAQLSMPGFAITGDSIGIIGKITNHTSAKEMLRRTITHEGNSSQSIVTVDSILVDRIAVSADSDSVSVRYTIETESGYFDGEERTIAVMPPGIMETEGEFAILNGERKIAVETNPALGPVHVFAQASAVETFLDEIDRTVAYSYMCNEQTASKIKALAIKKHIFELTGKQFKEDKKAGELVKSLKSNVNGDGLWGWWGKGNTEVWISKQAIEALSKARQAGFRDASIPASCKRGLEQMITKTLESGEAARHKRDLLDIVTILRNDFSLRVNPALIRRISNLESGEYVDYLKNIEVLSAEGETISERQLETVLGLAHETAMGSLYWGRESDNPAIPRWFDHPSRSNTEATLTAYGILKRAGGYEKELERIRNYFFEIRREGYWRNTYESSRIIETIMTDLLDGDTSYKRAELKINGEKIEKFPYEGLVDAGDSVCVEKTGTLPIFLTIYQQARNTAPAASGNTFTVRSTLIENGRKVESLSAGSSVQLQVEVDAKSEAHYVMIEIPIPAGCSYANKGQRSNRYEIHREYFKEKVSIFCQLLPQGEHLFTVDLTPRFTGRYTLNPASAGLMYFPTLSGREGIKSITVTDRVP